MIQERIAPLDARAANQAALLAAQRKTQGQSVDLRDALIAGIALAHEAQLATRNVRHFSDYHHQLDQSLCHRSTLWLS